MRHLIILFFASLSFVAAAEVVLDAHSEIVLAADAPSATKLAADELGFFL